MTRYAKWVHFDGQAGAVPALDRCAASHSPSLLASLPRMTANAIPRKKPARPPSAARLRLAPEASEALSGLASAFDLSRAEVVRRLVRAATEIGPALSAQNNATVLTLAVQVRRVGRNLDQLLHAIHTGRAVMIADAEPVFRDLAEAVADVEARLDAMTAGYAARLRRVADLPEIGP